MKRKEYALFSFLFLSVYFIFLVCLTFDCCIAERRILNGRKTSIIRHAYQVAIFKFINGSWKHQCGGSIINEYTILSAAHCFYDELIPNNYLTSVGSTNMYKGHLYTLKHIIIPSKYDPESKRYDIAIAKLFWPLNYNNNYIQPIPLQPANEEVPTGTIAVASGWGTTNFDLKIKPCNLYEVELTVIQEEICNSIYVNNVTDVAVCTGLSDSTLCHGDSGGPLVAGGKLIGVAIFVGPNCNVFLPQVFAKVSAL